MGNDGDDSMLLCSLTEELRFLKSLHLFPEALPQKSFSSKHKVFLRTQKLS